MASDALVCLLSSIVCLRKHLLRVPQKGASCNMSGTILYYERCIPARCAHISSFSKVPHYFRWEMCCCLGHCSCFLFIHPLLAKSAGKAVAGGCSCSEGDGSLRRPYLLYPLSFLLLSARNMSYFPPLKTNSIWMCTDGLPASSLSEATDDFWYTVNPCSTVILKRW